MAKKKITLEDVALEAAFWAARGFKDPELVAYTALKFGRGRVERCKGVPYWLKIIVNTGLQLLKAREAKKNKKPTPKPTPKPKTTKTTGK